MPQTRTLLPQQLPETSKISAENEKTVAKATVFSLFFVIEHIAVQRVFLYAGFGGNCLDRILLGLALLQAAADGETVEITSDRTVTTMRLDEAMARQLKKEAVGDYEVW